MSRPTPTKLKVLTGNPGKRPLNDREPQGRRGLPACPAHLDAKGKAMWKRLGGQLDQMGVMTLADGPALELLCAVYAEWRDAEKVARQKGQTYETESDAGGVMIRMRPEVRIAADAMRRAQSLLGEFGLTPSARVRLKVDVPDPEADALDEFLKHG